MAVITAPQSKNNSLGLLGSLAFFGGTLTGQPWLTALGTGMNAANKMINGQGNMNDMKTNQDAFQESMEGLWNLVNPASNNIAKAPGDGSHILDYMRKNFSW